MDADHLLIMALVCAAAYFAGYRNIALALLLVVGLVFLFGGKKEKSYYAVPGGGVRVHGAQSPAQHAGVDTSRRKVTLQLFQ